MHRERLRELAYKCLEYSLLDTDFRLLVAAYGEVSGMIIIKNKWFVEHLRCRPGATFREVASVCEYKEGYTIVMIRIVESDAYITYMERWY